MGRPGRHTDSPTTTGPEEITAYVPEETIIQAFYRTKEVMGRRWRRGALIFRVGRGITPSGSEGEPEEGPPEEGTT